ncbi:MAG: hypothetical protein WC211_00875 [Dehalococcoidia bacterium]
MQPHIAELRKQVEMAANKHATAEVRFRRLADAVPLDKETAIEAARAEQAAHEGLMETVDAYAMAIANNELADQPLKGISLALRTIALSPSEHAADRVAAARLMLDARATLIESDPLPREAAR